MAINIAHGNWLCQYTSKQRTIIFLFKIKLQDKYDWHFTRYLNMNFPDKPVYNKKENKILDVNLWMGDIMLCMLRLKTSDFPFSNMIFFLFHFPIWFFFFSWILLKHWCVKLRVLTKMYSRTKTLKLPLLVWWAVHGLFILSFYVISCSRVEWALLFSGCFEFNRSTIAFMLLVMKLLHTKWESFLDFLIECNPPFRWSVFLRKELGSNLVVKPYR